MILQAIRSGMRRAMAGDHVPWLPADPAAGISSKPRGAAVRRALHDPRLRSRGRPYLPGAGSFLAGAAIGILGGLVGLGGAEFRLPLLVGVFGFASLDAVILNKFMSLVVVAVSLPARSASIAWGEIGEQGLVVLDLLSGSLLGAWMGASWTMRLSGARLDRTIFPLLAGLALLMVFGHEVLAHPHAPLFESDPLHLVAGAIAGYAIGGVAAVLGVAGGELLIPVLVLFFGVGIKTAGSLSLCISLPTMLVAFLRYARGGALDLVRRESRFLAWMATGSVVGSLIGGRLLLGTVPSDVLVLVLGLVLFVSAVKTFMHAKGRIQVRQIPDAPRFRRSGCHHLASRRHP